MAFGIFVKILVFGVMDFGIFVKILLFVVMDFGIFGVYFLVSAAEYLVEEWTEPLIFTEICAQPLYTPPFM